MQATIEALAGRFAGRIGSTIRYLDRIDSTNRLALELQAREAPHGLVIVAREQTAGRGRQGRSWLSLPEVGLHFTSLMRPEIPGVDVPLLTLAGALAVYDALGEFCKTDLDIRWPNDVILAGGKVSGILGEAAYIGNRLERVVLGISINVGHQADAFAPGMPTRPTSIRIAEGIAPPLPEVLASVLEQINRWYEPLAEGRSGEIVEAMSERSSWVQGRSLVVYSGEERIEGTSAGLEPDGSLRMRLPSGVETVLRAGEIRVLEN